MLIRAKPCIVAKVSDIQTDYVLSACSDVRTVGCNVKLKERDIILLPG